MSLRVGVVENRFQLHNALYFLGGKKQHLGKLRDVQKGRNSGSKSETTSSQKRSLRLLALGGLLASCRRLVGRIALRGKHRRSKSPVSLETEKSHGGVTRETHRFIVIVIVVLVTITVLVALVILIVLIKSLILASFASVPHDCVRDDLGGNGLAHLLKSREKTREKGERRTE